MSATVRFLIEVVVKTNAPLDAKAIAASIADAVFQRGVTYEADYATGVFEYVVADDPAVQAASRWNVTPKRTMRLRPRRRHP